MKFGKTLLSRIDECVSWSAHMFVHYKKLKKSIKSMVVCVQREGITATQPAAGFARLLQKELVKVNQTYEGITRDISRRIDGIASAREPASGGPASDTKEAAFTQIGMLRQYVNLNREAVRKIVKKFKKKLCLELPAMACDLSPYAFGTDSNIIILTQRLAALDVKARVQPVSLPFYGGTVDIRSPQNMHILIELQKLRKLLFATLTPLEPLKPVSGERKALLAGEKSEEGGNQAALVAGKRLRSDAWPPAPSPKKRGRLDSRVSIVSFSSPRLLGVSIYSKTEDGDVDENGVSGDPMPTQDASWDPDSLFVETGIE